jgi:hypothetical protein
VPYIEHRGGSIRVKWWGGEYKLDADGKPTKRKKYEGVSGPEPGVPFTDEEEAYNYGLDREHDVRHGKHIRRADGKTLMKDYCWSWHGALDLRETSEDRYASRLRARIVPYWGERPVGDITAWEYETWKKGLKAAVASGELSRYYVDQLLSLFGMLMTDAVVKYRLRSDSPVVVQRGRGRYEKKKREKKRPMEMEVLHQLATNAHAVWGYTGWVCIWTIAFTGMRPPGEVFGLRREYASPTWPKSEPDADLRKEVMERYAETPALRVQWQVQHSKKRGGRVLVEPKYESHRTLVVPPFLHEMHAALLASHDSPWVFPGVDGRQMGTQFSRHYWQPVRDGSKERTRRADWLRPEIPAVKAMEGKRIYLLRHGHKEWLDESGHSVTAQETRMGHELAGVQGLYANLTPRMEQAIVESLQERWEKFMGDGGRWQPPFPSPLPSGSSVTP